MHIKACERKAVTVLTKRAHPPPSLFQRACTGQLLPRCSQDDKHAIYVWCEQHREQIQQIILTIVEAAQATKTRYRRALDKFLQANDTCSHMLVLESARYDKLYIHSVPISALSAGNL